MRNIRNLVLLFLLLTTASSCECIFGGHRHPTYYRYNLSLSFQDASGNDLVKGIESNEALSETVLDIIVFEPCENWDNRIYNAPARPGVMPDINRPYFIVKRYDGVRSYLENNFSLPMSGCPAEKILTYKLTCPYVFGDEEVHEFVTHWKFIQRKEEQDNFAECYLIEFEGREIIPIKGYDGSSMATVTLGQ
ncbi:MAG: hypothetical protein LBN06_05635 [Prevotellaceae bacterium]|jgi:hypothetical protein|nr:hypothetical protein [Prevotellaceae bacterium]